MKFFSWRTLKQFMGYGAVGALNTALNFLLLNIFIIFTGITSGPIFLAVSFVVFFLVIAHSFLWNNYLVFARERDAALRHREYLSFFLISSATALGALALLHLLVDVVGAPAWISPHLWANVALAITVPFSVTCNFLGYKFFVFAGH